MPQSDHQLLIESKPYLYASIFSGLLCFSALLDGQILFAVQSAILCLILLTNRIANNSIKNEAQGLLWLKRTSTALGIITIIGLMLGIGGAKTWLYFTPLLLFFVYPFQTAIWLVGGFSFLALLSLNANPLILENIQVSLNYILFLGISSSLVYLRELRRRQLKPLRKTDNLTKAATREHLDDDLTKEIQRSEREGSELSTMALAIDTACIAKLSPKEQDTVTIDIGKLLHNNLRLFDSYYLWEHHEFLIVLPHTSSSQAIKIANALRIQIRKDITVNDESITVSVGVSGLNIGDDSHTLTFRAAQALEETLAKSSNRTHLYREPDEVSHEKNVLQKSPNSKHSSGQTKGTSE